ncbi:hypothetical protein [Lysinibacillus sp. FJAT-14745]|uniref:hypothetical protein n=1 Tax=Lysinibacillus sp. FJAT-14745 TaxID=1704289 RepID=UPI000A931A6D|nr:hypothetical protein [Lysinibacillus sp. FJAT-14745]
MANKGGTAETTAFSSFFIRTRALFLSAFSKCFGGESVATAKRQLHMFFVAKAKRQL